MCINNYRGQASELGLRVGAQGLGFRVEPGCHRIRPVGLPERGPPIADGVALTLTLTLALTLT